MNSSTALPIVPDFLHQVLLLFLELPKREAILLWSIAKPILVAHWFLLLMILFFFFVVFFTKAMLGRWGSLGSLLYNTIYFGILLIVILIWGPETIVNDYFKVACSVILYPTCYFVTGIILDRVRSNR